MWLVWLVLCSSSLADELSHARICGINLGMTAQAVVLLHGESSPELRISYGSGEYWKYPVRVDGREDSLIVSFESDTLLVRTVSGPLLELSTARELGRVRLDDLRAEWGTEVASWPSGPEDLLLDYVWHFEEIRVRVQFDSQGVARRYTLAKYG